MVDEPEELKEVKLRILKVLAAVQDVGDFRLREIMSQLGFEPGRSILFYRALVKEAREVFSLIDIFEEIIDSDIKIKRQLKANLEATRQQLRTQQAKVHSLQSGTHLKRESLEKEKQAISELQAKVSGYEALTELLRGESKPQTLKLMSDLYFDMYTAAINAISYKRPSPDPRRLDELRQELAVELRDLLRIPQEKLEKEIDAVRAKNKELQNTNTALALSYGALRQQGWVDTSPDKTPGEGDTVI